MDTRLTVISIILVGIGLALRYWMNRRHFNRNNYAGVQTFRSYEHKVVVGPVERLIKFLGLLLLLAGAIILFVMYSNQRSAERYRQEQVKQNHP